MASSSNARSYVAAVVGATGATGAALVDALARSDRFSRVVAIARSPPVDVAAAAPATRKVEWRKFSLEDLSRAAAAAATGTEAAAATGTEAASTAADDDDDKKHQHLPSSSSSSSNNPLEGVDAVFCALGTTRADAGSARAFWDVDVGGPESVAKLAGKAAAAAASAAEAAAPASSSSSPPSSSPSSPPSSSPPSPPKPRVLSLVSASGASRNSVFKHLASFPSLLHPLYYSAAKGAAEQAFVSAGSGPSSSSSSGAVIDSVLVYRPGLLDRGDGRRRGGESWAIKLGFPSLKVEDLARVMVADVVEALEKRKEGGGTGAEEVIRGDAEIKRKAASLAAR